MVPTVIDGAAPRGRRGPSLTVRLTLLLAVLLGLMAASAAFGLYSARALVRSTETLVQDRIIPVQQLRLVSDAYLLRIGNVALRLSEGGFDREGLEQVAFAQTVARRHWADYLLTYLVPEERRLIEQAERALAAADRAVAQMSEGLASGNLAAARRVARQDVPAALGVLQDVLGRLIELQLQVAQQEGEASRESYRRLAAASAALIGLAALAGGLLTWMVLARYRVTAADLKRANTLLREADARKNQFLAMLSHELRNPLAAIRNSLYVLQKVAPDSGEAGRAHAVVDRQALHLARLVDDLLDVTRIAHGKIRLRRHPVDLVTLVHAAADDHRESFARAGVDFELRAPRGPLCVHGDATRLMQVVGNLLNNAAKFTPQGGRARLTLERGDDRHAVLRVTDSGVGMDEATLHRVFEPFAQADVSLDRSTGGLGLGLALVRGLVELHHGSVRAHSDGPGRGTEVTVHLPCEPLSSPATGPDAAPAQRGARRILVIEDNADAALSLQQALTLVGHEVQTAHDGPEGLERARSWGPDVVLCDIGLPRMDGYQVARAIRQDQALARVRLVALTGYAQPEDADRALAAGFDGHLSKPAELSEIERAISGVQTPEPAT